MIHTARAARLVVALLVPMVVLAGCEQSAAPTPAGSPGTGGPPTATADPARTVVVAHWAAGELMSPGLLPTFAERFNAEKRKTASGKTIVVAPTLVNSGRQAELLTARVGRGVALDPQVPDPVLVTPSVDHWLSQVNADTGREVVDLAATQDLAVAFVGIVTYREMAECLGWPAKDIGIADIVALRQDPRGWASCPTAKAEWGQQIRVSFSDPTSSSTARSTLFALYGIGAGKAPDQLTPDDVTGATASGYVRNFQSGIDHYVADTLVLQSKLYGGPRYVHFAFVEENTLVQLYQGKLPVTVGAQTKPQPLSREMVMLYPREGSYAHTHPAGLVRADWVSEEQTAAARQWVDYLRAEPQQRAFMAEGFRPATPLPLADTISARFGLDPTKPTRVLKAVNPTAATAIMRAWSDVKKPGVAVLVIDVSGSMQGQRLAQAKEGAVRLLSSMNSRNSVGLVTFSDTVKDRIAVGPVGETQFEIEKVVRGLRADGGTALYDGVLEGIKMADQAAATPDAMRGVVVLTDGEATAGKAGLSQVVRLMSRNEAPIAAFRGFRDDRAATDATGAQVPLADLIGSELAVPTTHAVHVFFVAVGEADVHVGRVMAEATGGAYRPATESGLAAVLEAFGKYF